MDMNGIKVCVTVAWIMNTRNDVKVENRASLRVCHLEQRRKLNHYKNRILSQKPEQHKCFHPQTPLFLEAILLLQTLDRTFTGAKRMELHEVMFLKLSPAYSCARGRIVKSKIKVLPDLERERQLQRLVLAVQDKFSNYTNRKFYKNTIFWKFNLTQAFCTRIIFVESMQTLSMRMQPEWLRNL